ncbi:MAG: hypothetical protein RRB13_11245 [bacterium]|nr:hypothetical protein [bacterium]
MPKFNETIEGYLQELESSGLARAEIYFNDFQTMTVGGLLADVLKFYPANKNADHALGDNEELRLAAEFRAFFALLESKRSEKEGPVVDRQLTKELNHFLEHIDSIFAKLFDRSDTRQTFDRDYFAAPQVRQLVRQAVVNLLRGAR